MSRKAILNLSSAFGLAPTGAQGTSAMRMTPQWTTGMREILLQKTRKSSHGENPASARIVLSTARRDLQRFNVQRHLSSAQSRRGDDHVARGRRGGLKIFSRRLITILISQCDEAVARK
jgi:hypothetical protein